MPFYAVRKGEKPGVYSTWSECQAQIKDFKGAQFKKFDTVDEAEKFLGFDLAKKVKDQLDKLKAEHKDEENGQSKGSKRKSEESKSNKKDSKKSKKEESSDEDSSDSADEGGGGDGPSAGGLVLSDIVPESVLKRAKELSTKDYPTSDDGYVLCYTDGACFAMGKKGQVAGAGVYFGPDHKMNLSEPIKDGKPHTNNRSKILAVVFAVEALKASGVTKTQIHLDSEFTINCVDKWTPGWKKKGWKTAAGVDVKNKEELQLLDKLSTMDIRYSRSADEAEPSGYSEATKLAKDGAKKTCA